MANGKIRFGKQSGGQLALVIPDGVDNTEVTFPESGTLVSVGTTVTDNAIARYDGTTGKVQNSGVVIDDSGNLCLGTSTPINYLGYKTLEIKGVDSSHGGVVRISNSDESCSGIFFSQVAQVTLGTQTNMPLTFTINNVEKARIANTGNLLVGTTTDNGVDKLQVNGSISSGTIYQYASGDLNNFKYITQTVGMYPTLSNVPVNDHGYLEIIVYSANTHVMQRFTTLGILQTAGRVFVRCLNNSTWTAWAEK